MWKAAMNCPSCGAPIHLKPGEDSFQCDYCQSVYVPEPGQDGVRVLGEASDEPCPNCNLPLTQAAIAKVRILYCTKCRGMLIPMEAFTGLIDQLQILQGGSMVQPPADTSDLRHVVSCPQCRQHMESHLYEGPGNVVIDSCEKCLLNWLNHGELARIVHAPDDRNPATILDMGPNRYEDTDA
jgi:LSD1 subclass zinc finger protein